jgi:hypothetical protein
MRIFLIGLIKEIFKENRKFDFYQVEIKIIGNSNMKCNYNIQAKKISNK